jgi:hypothetical protein
VSKYRLTNVTILLGLLFVLSVLPFCFPAISKQKNNSKHYELYNPELSRLSSVKKLSYYIDSLYALENFSKKFDTALYVKMSSDVVKRRFYHGLSHYTFSDNWIAALAGKLAWSHFSAIVKPNDILKHSEGLCSQQTIVFLEVLKIKGINFRTIGLGFKKGPGHFLSEVNYNGAWHLHDVTVEPHWEKVMNHHKSMEFYQQNKDSLFSVYQGRLDRNVFSKIMEKVEYGKVNDVPARKMLLFHQITFTLTFLLPIVFFIAFIFSLFKRPRH